MARFLTAHLRSRAAGTPTRETAGFTLIELLMGTVVLSVALIGALVSFNITTSQTTNAGTRNERQAAVDQDLADVLQRNDRYSCGNLPATGGASADCAVAADDPGEDGYAPVPVPTESYEGSGYERFKTLCENDNTLTVNPNPTGPPIPSSNALLSALVNNINAAADPPGIARVAELDPQVPHLYWVTYTDTATDQQLRRIALTPSVARWCPELESPDS